MFFCNDCRVSYETPLFRCPSCGAELVKCYAEGDTVVFVSGNNWRQVRAVAIRGRIQKHIVSGDLTLRNFEVISGEGIKAEMSLQRLYEVLSGPGEVIEL